MNLLQDKLHTRSLLTEKGFLLTIGLSAVLFFIFFGHLLPDINNFYFSPWGDGIQSYTSVVYHAQWDTEAFYSKGMQYPYGDNFYFSVNPALLPTVLQKLDAVIPVAGYAVGIFNFSVIISPLIGAAFLYLIFRYLKVGSYYAAVFATLIAFVSPQLFRFPGHNSLGYVFALPVLIYLVIIFYERPTWVKTLILMIYTYVMSSTHLYYFAFFGLTTFLFYAFMLIEEQADRKKVLNYALHFFVQMIVPFILMQLIVSFVDPSQTRSDYPWGFFASFSSLTGILYPLNSYYEHIIMFFGKPGYHSWEGISYLGLPAALSFIAVLLIILRKLVNRHFKQIWYVTDHKVLNALFWTAFVALLVSFGCPFWGEWGEKLYEHTSLYKQLRGVGRFAWAFYYIFNVIVFYKLFFWMKKTPHKVWATIVIVLAAGIETLDAFAYGAQAKGYANRIEELSDKNNTSELNAWMGRHDLTAYQAIIGLPYFHNGSDNFYMERECSGMRDAMIYSMKTGLPMLNSHMCRTPVDETINNISLVLEPYRPLQIVKDFPDQRPFLMLWRKDCPLNDMEAALRSRATLIDSSVTCYFYTLEMNVLVSMTDSLFQKTEAKIAQETYHQAGDIFSTDPASEYVLDHFEGRSSSEAYLGKGAFQHPCQEYLTFFDGMLPGGKHHDWVASFWVGNMREDVIPRGYFEIMLTDESGNVYEKYVNNIGKEVRIIDGNWALVERNIHLKNPGDRVKITVWNSEISGKMNIIDELMIRPVNTNIYYHKQDTLVYNNRYYLKSN